MNNRYFQQTTCTFMQSWYHQKRVNTTLIDDFESTTVADIINGDFP